MPAIKIILRKDKILSNGFHPVCLRVTFKRKPKYYVLKAEQGTISSDPNKWNSEIGRFNRNRELNQKIELYEMEARNALSEIKSKDFSFQAFEKKFFKQHSDSKVIPFIDTVIEKLKNENRYGTAQVYKDTKNRITEFNAKAGFEDINLKFLQKFERYLIDKGNSTNSISIYMRTLRAAYNKASAEEVFTSNEFPFKKFRIKSGNAAKRSLTKDDILKLMNYDPKGSDRIRRSLDYFIFSYLCRGMNLRDMAQLKWEENVMDD